MAQGKKTSSQKKSEVLIAKIKDPEKSLRDIEKETGVKKDAAWDIINKDLPELATSSDILKNLLEKDLEILDAIQKRKAERIKDKEKPVNDNDIDKWDNTATKRRLLFENKGKWDDKTPITIQI